MSEECTHDCSTCSANCASKKEAIPKEQTNAYSHVKHVIAVVSGKGGVGKSMMTSLLAVLSARKGYKTAVLDADITGPSIPRVFGLVSEATGSEKGINPIMTKTGIATMSVNYLLENPTDPVIWRGPVLAGTVKQFYTDVVWDEVDYMFVDMPPGTGDVPLTVFQSLPVDGIVVVTSPQELVSMIVEKAVKMADMMHIPVIGLVENMSYFLCPNCKEKHEIFGASHAEDIAKNYAIPALARVPMDKKLVAGADAGLIELFEGDFLDGLFASIEERFKVD